MITIANSIFNVQGANVKDKVYGVVLNGAEDVVIKGCTFANKGYSSVLNHCTGSVAIEDCVFECDNVYNPIEGSQSANNGNVTVKNCKFNGKPGNNYVNFYQVAANSEHVVANCSFNPSVDNNIVRISNRTSVPMTLTVADCKYDYLEGEPSEYTGFLLCQDYTNKNGVKQDFTKVKVELNNVLCNGEKVTSAGAALGKIFYVYEDGAGILAEGNDPVVVVK